MGESTRRVMGNKHKPTAPTAPRGKRSARERAESTKRHLGYAESFISTRIVEAFNSIDADKDGYLSAADLSHTLGAYGIGEEAAKVSEIIYELDDTGDGRLSLAQVLDGMARLQRSKLRAAGTGTNILRAMLEFMIFDVHGQFKTLDDTELTKLLFVYCGFNGTKLDQQLASFKGLLAGKKCDLSNFMLVMDEMQLISDLSPEVFAVETKKKVENRHTSLTAAAHNQRLFDRMTGQLEFPADESKSARTKQSVRRNKLLAQPPNTARQTEPDANTGRRRTSRRLSPRRPTGSGAVTDRAAHRAVLREEKFKRMATIVQGEMAQERKAAKEKLQELKAKGKLTTLPYLVQQDKLPSIIKEQNPPAEEDSELVAPKRFLSVSGSRRASVSGDCGMLTISEEAPNRQFRPQVAHFKPNTAIEAVVVPKVPLATKERAKKSRVRRDSIARIERWEQALKM